MNRNIEELDNYIQNIKNLITEESELNETEKEQVRAIAEKSLSALKETKVKLEGVKQQISSEEEYQEFVNRVLNKTDDVYKMTMTKYEEIHTRHQVEARREDIIETVKANMEAEKEEVREAVTLADKAAEALTSKMNEFKDAAVDLSNKAAEKTAEAFDNALQKAEIASKEAKNALLNKVSEAESALLKELQNNENLKPAVKMVKTIEPKVNSFVENVKNIDPQKVMNDISLSALKAADKGLDVLLKLLEKGNKNG